MVTLPIILSIIFFSISIVYFFYGTYIHIINFKSTINRLFFIGCMCLTIWAVSYSIAISAPDHETSILWRRVASIGWGSFFSVMLHFFLILSEKTELLKKKWIYLVIYIPAFFFSFIFSIFQPVAGTAYDLIYTELGWVNIASYKIWDWAYSLYYMTFSFAGILILVKWGLVSHNIFKKRQVVIIGASFAVSGLIGTTTEFVLNPVFGRNTPQIAPIVLFIPMTVMFYYIKRYGLMLPTVKNQPAFYGQILSAARRELLYIYLSRAYFLGAFISFGVRYFSGKESLVTALTFSIIMLVLGLALQAVQFIKISDEDKDSLSNAIMTISIPIISIKYYARGPLYLWVVPVIFILAAVAFNQRQMLALTAAATIVTLAFFWYKIPYMSVDFTPIDHFVRILVLIIVMFFAFYINRVYVERLMENEEQVLLQKMLSNISTFFVTANEKNIGTKFKETVHLCGENFKADRIYIVFFATGENNSNTTYEWCKHGIVPKKELINSYDFNNVPQWMDFDSMLKNEGINILDVSNIPAGSPERVWLEKNKISSLLLQPLRNKDKVIGLMVLETLYKPIKIRKEQIDIIRVLAHLISDIWLKIVAEKEIQFRAYYDPLTGLPNRTLLTNRMEQALDLARRTEKLVGVLYVDIDAFKVINDTIGHKGGDAILLQIGKRLCNSVRQYDTVAHFGGDEFLIMIPQIPTVDDVLKVAEKIIDGIKKPFQYENQEYFVTASVGISVFPFDGDGTDEMIKNADLAMFFSKENGRNKCTLCSSTMKKEAWQNMELTNNLYRALEREEFVLFYQPQVQASTGKIIGAEALIRWNHPQKGLISPGIFIPLAEKTGLINNIGQWVLKEACTQSKRWQELGVEPIKMAVNLSLGQFLNPNLVHMVKHILETTHTNPAFLELEITESIACYDQEYIIETMNRLKELGVSISIDDFGTEYSSLSRLKTMPIDKIKIDMKFVHGINTESKDEGIIKVILQMGRTFGLKVIAEGVENQEQLEFLKLNQCDEIQGYYFYKPLPPEKLFPILKQSSEA